MKFCMDTGNKINLQFLHVSVPVNERAETLRLYGVCEKFNVIKI
jgi:hypothetical protein